MADFLRCLSAIVYPLRPLHCWGLAACATQALGGAALAFRRCAVATVVAALAPPLRGRIPVALLRRRRHTSHAGRGRPSAARGARGARAGLLPMFSGYALPHSGERYAELYVAHAKYRGRALAMSTDGHGATSAPRALILT